MWLGSGPTTQSAAASLKDRPASYRCYEEFQRSRAKQLKTASQRRLQSTAVDFRRVWWDKDARYPSKTGLSFWRPIPPQGYISLGDFTGPNNPSYILLLTLCWVFQQWSMCCSHVYLWERPVTEDTA